MLTKNGKLFYGFGSMKSSTNCSGYKLCSGGLKSITSGTYDRGIIDVGNGTTAPTVDDYCMESENTTLTYISDSRDVPIKTDYEKDYIYSCTTTYKNNTSNPITITELGLYRTSSGNTASVPIEESAPISTFGVLIAREVIDPVIINPNETKTFTMVIGN
jgi:hypothetical protein